MGVKITIDNSNFGGNVSIGNNAKIPGDFEANVTNTYAKERNYNS